MLEVTDATFTQEVLQSPQPVVVDFWAVWCGPCKALGPILERAAQEFEGRVKFVKVNIDATTLAARYNIRAVPTLVLVKDGEVVTTLVGMNSQSKIASWLMVNL